MNTRERFLATLAFEPVDRGLLWEVGYWAEAGRRWYAEGLPGQNRIPDKAGITPCVITPGNFALVLGEKYGWNIDRDVTRYFGLDKPALRLPVKPWIWPPFEKKVVEDRGETVVIQGPDGELRENTKGMEGMSQLVRGPVSSREDWEALKDERLQPDLEARIPANWDDLVRSARDRDYPLIIGGFPCGMHSSLLSLFGELGYYYALHDQRDLLAEILDYLTDFWIALWDQALDQVSADGCFIFEDMCCNTGPIVSPVVVRELMLPRYKRLTSFLRSRGVTNILLDTDGDCRPLIPIYLEGGITAIEPWEVTNGQDIVAIREQYPKLGIVGGIDKRAVAAGKLAIDRELEAKVPFMFERGGFIAVTDNGVTHEASWEDFSYYRRRLAEMLGH